MINPAIVVIAYNRPDSLERVLKSLENSIIPEGISPTLIISIDKSDSDKTAEVARNFEWKFGPKRVVERPERMGLRNHVLSCGDFAKEYGSIIVLEDDLYVSPSFYEYSIKALEFTKDDSRIGGVSLYNHLFNVHVREAFCALDDGYDNWYFAFASSWGQAYTASQWESFITWYNENKDDIRIQENPFIPANVSGWSDKSWLKYYIAYLIETNRYFLYPKVSFTTNFGDVGSHMDKIDNDLQVPLCSGKNLSSFEFSTLDNSQSVYDAFFENVRLEKCLKRFLQADDKDSVIVDLYGSKPVKEMALKLQPAGIISSAELPYRIVKSYGRNMRPLDANIVYDILGSTFNLYDTKNAAELTTDIQKRKSQERAAKWFYQYRGISAAQMKDMILYRIKEAVVNRLRRK